jgi:hypothetical protein
MLNVLIRTSYRPYAFRRCLDSIPSTPDVRIVVSYDDEAALQYIPNNVTKVDVTHLRSPESPFWYNTYCNALADQVSEGHGIFLDDDDVFISANGIKLERGTSYIIPFLRGVNFTPKPTLAQMQAKKIVAGYIGLPSLIFAAEHRNMLHFYSGELADYNAIKAFSLVCPSLRWINIPLVRSFERNLGKLE